MAGEPSGPLERTELRCQLLLHIRRDGGVSLNRYEQLLADYIDNHPDERRYWNAQVVERARRGGRRESVVLDLNSALWEYFEERSRHASPFREIAVEDGGRRVSMLNLAEFYLRIWGPPPKSAPKRT